MLNDGLPLENTHILFLFSLIKIFLNFTFFLIHFEQLSYGCPNHLIWMKCIRIKCIILGWASKSHLMSSPEVTCSFCRKKKNILENYIIFGTWHSEKGKNTNYVWTRLFKTMWPVNAKYRKQSKYTHIGKWFIKQWTQWKCNCEMNEESSMNWCAIIPRECCYVKEERYKNCMVDSVSH